MPHKTEKKTKQLLRWLLTFIKNQGSEKNRLDFVKVVHITHYANFCISFLCFKLLIKKFSNIGCFFFC